MVSEEIGIYGMFDGTSLRISLKPFNVDSTSKSQSYSDGNDPVFEATQINTM